MKKLPALSLITVLFICVSSLASAQIVLRPAGGFMFGAQSDTTEHNQPVVGLDFHANFIPGPVTLGFGFFVGGTTSPNNSSLRQDPDMMPDFAFTYGLTLPVSIKIHQRASDDVATYLTFAYSRSLWVAGGADNFNALMVGLSFGL